MSIFKKKIYIFNFYIKNFFVYVQQIIYKFKKREVILDFIIYFTYKYYKLFLYIISDHIVIAVV